ncbi:T9SS type A sorting domain-containing protein [Prevotella sp. Rep29]|nr:T9SS type A sorting domain-containing protein [Prevotella sp. Rep29]QYR10851.1 T9SS type A sorting domain-containing protein [Prevotella sp. Rep29]
MIKKILTICFSAALILCVPMISRAITAVEIIDNDIQTITISVTESTLHVAGANGQMLQIYNVAGICVMNIKVEGADKRYELNLPKGCYIVKVGKVTRKISIR